MREPTATYRFQLREGRALVDVERLVPYLHDLGIRDVYLPPIQRARRGSTHGYDGVDPTRLDPVLGTEADLEGLAVALRRHGMGLILDLVPNHLAASSENRLWRDVLEHGPASAYAAWFDVDWVAEPTLVDRVLLPVLGRPYGEALEAGELVLALGRSTLQLRYWDRAWPIDPGTWGPLLADVLPEPTADVAEEWTKLLALVGTVPPRRARTRRAIARRRRVTRAIERLIRDGSPALRDRLEAAVARANGRPGDPRSFDRLDALLLQQPYRLVYWRSGYERLNYRRFFNINELVGLRVEEDGPFAHVAAWPLELVRRGWATGLRIDHVDGLYDPTGFLARLQDRLTAITGEPGYVVVEKILMPGEALPAEWAVHGTTGYEVGAAATAALVDPEGVARLDAAYERTIGRAVPWDDLVHTQKRRMIGKFFAPEIDALERHLRRIAAMDRHGRDLSPPQLAAALQEVTACLPVYRTYVRGAPVDERDRAVIEGATEDALRRGEADPRALAFLRRVLLLDLPDGLTEGERATWLRFVLRWQQLTGPAMAKGVEDTAFYIYNRLACLNEVGGEPAFPRDPVGKWHREAAERQERWPLSLSATSTHDTKRSEDVRARIAVLSELPDVWIDGFQRWSEEIAARGVELPDVWIRSLVFQTLLGAWPIEEGEHADRAAFADRIDAYLVKAAREAKLDSDWLDPNEEAERRLTRFARSVIEAPPEGFLDLERRVAVHGACNALAQVALKLWGPGVPDVYQGQELWDQSLVDPDNRRPVDFPRRRRALRELDAALAADRRGTLADVVRKWRDGRPKLLMTSALLRRRAAERPLFRSGAYLPLEIVGRHAACAMAFARRHEDRWALLVVPRLTTRLGDGFPLGDVWADTAVRLPAGAPGDWEDVVTLTGRTAEGGRLALATLLDRFPVAACSG